MYYATLLVCRCFLSAGSPASCPSRSRIVEALCILLCEKYPHPRKEQNGDWFTLVHGFVNATYNVVENGRLDTLFRLNVKGETAFPSLFISGIITAGAGGAASE